MATELCVKRVYERYDVADGTSILVDRLWPRGVRKHSPNVEIWMKDIAPTDELRRWYSHNPMRWAEFKKRYTAELRSNPALEDIIEFIKSTQKVTLMYASSDTKRNNAVVLRDFIARRLKI